MTRKIIGVTVGTTLNPKKIAGNTEHSHSWNELTDRPFYAIEGETKTLTFNGDISSVDVALGGDETGDGVNDIFLIKMSDDAPEPSDLIGGYYSFVEQDGNVVTQEITEEFLQENCGYFKPSVGECLSGSGYNLGAVTVYTEDTEMIVGDTTHTFDKGIYFMYMSVPEIGTAYTKELSYGVPEQVKQLDMKFIPDALKTHYVISEGGSVNLTFDGDITGKEYIEVVAPTGETVGHYVKLTDDVLDASQLVGATVVGVFNGEEQTIIIEEGSEFIGNIADIGMTSGKGYYIHEAFLVIQEDVTITTVSEVVLTKGIWTLLYMSESAGATYGKSLTCNVPEQVKQLDMKFIPDEVATKEYVDRLLGTSIEEIASLVGGDA